MIFSSKYSRKGQSLLLSLVECDTCLRPLLFPEKKSKPRDSNRSLVTELMHAEASSPETGKDSTSSASVVLEKMPQFKTKVAEIKWKLNKARKKLKVAKQYVALADKVSAMKKKGNDASQTVKDVIRKAEIALVHAGEHMGLDYVHFKR